MENRLEVVAGGADGEFVPPLQLPETWGAAWDRQLNAALAWQEAEAAADALTSATQSQWGASIEIPHPSGTVASCGAGGHTFRTLTGMNALLGSLRERLLQIHSETLDVAGDEITQNYVESSGTAGGCDSSRPLHPESARRLNELTDRWFDALASAQAEMSALTGISARRAFGISTLMPAANGPLSSGQRVQ